LIVCKDRHDGLHETQITLSLGAAHTRCSGSDARCTHSRKKLLTTKILRVDCAALMHLKSYQSTVTTPRASACVTAFALEFCASGVCGEVTD
jgi:hypothetical protein